MKICEHCGSLNWDSCNSCVVCANTKLCDRDYECGLRSAMMLAWMTRRSVFDNSSLLIAALNDIYPALLKDDILMAALRRVFPLIRYLAEGGDAVANESRIALAGTRRPFPDDVVCEVVDAFEALARLVSDREDFVNNPRFVIENYSISNRVSSGLLKDQCTTAPPNTSVVAQDNDKEYFKLGLQYEDGRGVEQDYSQAARLYQLAADRGDSRAQFNLGLLYEDGHGVEQDYSQAARLYQLATDQGDADAQNNLAVLYLNGRGVPQNYSTAADLFGRAARQGDAYAIYNLGRLYDTGRGVRKNHAKAKQYYAIAREYADKYKDGVEKRRLIDLLEQQDS